jgi:ribosome biogenesis protein SSF1/2
VINEEDWVHHEPEDVKRAPHSFIIYRGKVGRYIKELMRDLRHLMEPFTASNLKA